MSPVDLLVCTNQSLQTNTSQSSPSVQILLCEGHHPRSSAFHSVSNNQEPVLLLPAACVTGCTSDTATDVLKKANPVRKYSALKDTYFYFSQGQAKVVFIDTKLPHQILYQYLMQRLVQESHLFTQTWTWNSGADISLVMMICQYMEFGFHVGVKTYSSAKLLPAIINHGSA